MANAGRAERALVTVGTRRRGFSTEENVLSFDDYISVNTFVLGT